MIQKAGRYSLIRYMHDIERGEFVNVGVVLFYCEKEGGQFYRLRWKYGIRIIPDSETERVEKFFGDRKDFDSDKFNNTKDSFVERLDNSKFETMPEIEDFINSRANNMRMSELCGIRIEEEKNIFDLLEELYEELVK